MFDCDILMCRPEHFTVNYSINPWMHPESQQGIPDQGLALTQWTRLHHLIIRCGGYVHYIDQQPGLPDMVFTANGGMVHDGRVVLARFANKERKGEESHFAKYFFDRFDEYNRLVLSPEEHFEGQGDAFVVNGTLFIGVNRTKKAVASKIMDFLGLKKLVYCELTNPEFYHLDTCFCPLSKGHVMFHPGAFSPDTLHAFETEAKINWISVGEDDARAFVCNAVNIKEHVIVPTPASDTASSVFSSLKLGGYKPHGINLSEFMKAGGAAKCLTLRI